MTRTITRIYFPTEDELAIVRADFEAQFKGWPLDRRITAPGGYQHPEVDAMWRGWLYSRVTYTKDV